MSHPVPSHDYSEQHNRETNKEYKARRKAGMSKALKKSKGISLPSKSSIGKLLHQLKEKKGENHLDRLKRLTS